jgi:hypothetical protein
VDNESPVWQLPEDRALIQVLVRMNHGRKEILGLQSKQIVKRRKKLRSKLRRRKMRKGTVKRKEMEQRGGQHNRRAFLVFSVIF